jgi:hypothetical protein
MRVQRKHGFLEAQNKEMSLQNQRTPPTLEDQVDYSLLVQVRTSFVQTQLGLSWFFSLLCYEQLATA